MRDCCQLMYSRMCEPKGEGEREGWREMDKGG